MKRKYFLILILAAYPIATAAIFIVERLLMHNVRFDNVSTVLVTISIWIYSVLKYMEK